MGYPALMKRGGDDAGERKCRKGKAAASACANMADGLTLP